MSEQIIKSVVIIETIQNECISVSHGLLKKNNTRTPIMGFTKMT